jgi:DNA-binding winged helix-turn-helix (wHTH) protein
VVDFDNSLNAVMRKLRVLLGDDSDTPRYIETLPRIGYRFIGKMDAPATPPPVDSQWRFAA